MIYFLSAIVGGTLGMILGVIVVTSVSEWRFYPDGFFVTRWREKRYPRIFYAHLIALGHRDLYIDLVGTTMRTQCSRCGKRFVAHFSEGMGGITRYQRSCDECLAERLEREITR